jgi:predicted nucleic acid-binding protein
MKRGKTLRIYLDTSVIGGCIDPEFAPWSNGLMKDFHEETFRPVISEVVTLELEFAPDSIKRVYASLQRLGAEILQVSEKALELAEVYQEREILTPKYYDDCLHIAMATVAEVDVLVSWNFRHIVHLNKIRMFNAVNAELGYRSMQIYSPREVTNYEIRDN